MSDRVMARTGWKCEACQCAGTIEYVKTASVYEVLHILEDDHRETDPLCVFDASKVRAWQIPELR